MGYVFLNINNDGKAQGEPAKIFTLSEEFQVFLKEPGRQIKEVQSVGAQIINKEMQLFEATKKRPENLEKIYRSLLTIRLTSVEAERAFSAMGLFATKIRNRLNDHTLNAMIIISLNTFHDCS